MKDYRVTKMVEQIQFEEVWWEIQSKKCFQRQSFTKYMALTLVFMWTNGLPEKYDFCFSWVFC